MSTNSHTLKPYTEFHKTPTTYEENTNINVKVGVYCGDFQGTGKAERHYGIVYTEFSLGSRM
jgi:hypothetical protein